MDLPKVFLVCILTTLSAALSHRFACHRSSGLRLFICALIKTSCRLEEKLYWLLESIDATSKAGESDILILMGI
jgi:hypothetical protein